MRLVQELRAPQDPNGNPRHLAIVYRTHKPAGSYCSIEAVFNLGYAGIQGIPEPYRHDLKLLSCLIPHKEWADYIRNFEVIRL